MKKKSLFALTTILTGLALLMTGCTEEAVETSATIEISSKANPMANQQQECCGNCATEAKVATKDAASKDSGCCGKCQTEETAKDAGGCAECQSAEATQEAKKASPATSAEGCCGNCATQQVNAKKDGTVQARQEEGCCGKCKTETKTEAKTNAEKGNQKACSGDCNACAEGNEEDCKCGHSEAGKQEKKTSETKVVAKPEMHVNSRPEDRDIFHHLLRNHEKIKREVVELDNGVKTKTYSSDPEIAAKIKEHVVSMHGRVKDTRPLRMWDDLYREIFKHTDKIEMTVTKIENGVEVIETSDDPYIAKLLKQHAKVVTGFTKRGFEEARLNHPVTREEDATAKSNNEQKTDASTKQKQIDPGK